MKTEFQSCSISINWSAKVAKDVQQKDRTVLIPVTKIIKLELDCRLLDAPKKIILT
jgi:hypothetical protein